MVMPRTMEITDDNRLSLCVSALIQHERGCNRTYDEMSYYGVWSDAVEDGILDKQLDRKFAIIAAYGFTWKTLIQAVAERTGVEIEFGISDWTGEECVKHSNPPASFSVGRHHEWWWALPDGSRQHYRVERMLAHTP